eukprot:scaffold133047_cov69-Phaeocystis_antarctica.AAC.1
MSSWIGRSSLDLSMPSSGGIHPRASCTLNLLWLNTTRMGLPWESAVCISRQQKKDEKYLGERTATKTLLLVTPATMPFSERSPSLAYLSSQLESSGSRLYSIWTAPSL